MVSNGGLGGIVFNLVVSLVGPFAAYFVLRRRMTLSWRNIGIGAGMFFLFALVLEQALHYVVLKADPVTAAWFKANHLALAAYGALCAGLFEESGRYVGLRFLVKPTGNPGTAVAYGLGHGGLEMLLIGGLAQAAALVLALLNNAGMLDAVLAGRVPPKVLATLHAQFAHLTFATASVAGFERLMALALHIALSFVVWRAIQLKKFWLLFAAIALHALADTGAGLFQTGLVKSVWIAEGGAFAALIITVLFVRWLPRPASA